MVVDVVYLEFIDFCVSVKVFFLPHHNFSIDISEYIFFLLISTESIKTFPFFLCTSFMSAIIDFVQI